LRRYDPNLKLTVKRTAPNGRDPYGVAIDPSGRRVAIGYYDQMPVSILDAKTLGPLARAQTDDLGDGDLSSVAWSRDGSTLVAAGQAQAQFDGKWREFLRRFDVNGRRVGADIAVSSNSVQDIQACGDDFIFAASDPAFGLLSARGVATTLQGPRTAEMREKLGSALTVSRDASSVRFGLEDGEEKPVVFDFYAASLTDSPNPPSGFQPARVDGLAATDWQNGYQPKFNGAKLALQNYEKSRALAIRPGASGFVLGADFTIRGYDAKGKERWNRAGPGVAWASTFRPTAKSSLLSMTTARSAGCAGQMVRSF
jgi:hypothetical protein